MLIPKDSVLIDLRTFRLSPEKEVFGIPHEADPDFEGSMHHALRELRDETEISDEERKFPLYAVLSQTKKTKKNPE